MKNRKYLLLLLVLVLVASLRKRHHHYDRCVSAHYDCFARNYGAHRKHRFI
jgi:hypothetical protein